jgi:dihydroorotate dehydrogenase electron transfer subunit
MPPPATAHAVADDGRRTIAPLGRRRLAVTSVEQLGAYIVLRVADPDGPPPRPGQFCMLAAVEGWGGDGGRPFLPRAFSILRARDATLEFMLEGVGPGTDRLAELRAEDEVWLTGPLGVGWRAPKDIPTTHPTPPGKVLLVGGGVGVPPLAGWQDELRARGIPERALLGFRDAEHAAAAALLADAQVATDDGSVGHHGLVTELLTAELDADPDALVCACGPPGMLEAVRALCVQRGVPGQLALEASMACGFGACFGCVVATHDAGYVRICVDGPVLDAARIVEGAIR